MDSLIAEFQGIGEDLGPGCLHCDLGLIPYSQAVAVMDELLRRRADGALPDILLFAEHPPTFTLGRFKRPVDFKPATVGLLEQVATICHTDRGGGVVYHGPGQLLVYPILGLRQLGLSVIDYVRNLEELAIRTLRAFQIEGHRKGGYPGVWVGEAKIGFIGVHIGRGISKHGLALNVDPDLHYFDYIDCCGIPDVRITSMSRLRGDDLDMSLVKETMLGAFEAVFGIHVESGDLCLPQLR